MAGGCLRAEGPCALTMRSRRRGARPEDLVVRNLAVDSAGISWAGVARSGSVGLTCLVARLREVVSLGMR